MKTQKETEKEIGELEREIRFECKKYCDFEKLSKSNEKYEIEEWLKSSIKLGELKALLQQSKEFIEMIEKFKNKLKDINDFLLRKDNPKYEDWIQEKMEELKSSLIGSEEK